ncbi:MAG: hypothetical protein ABII82_02005 [Verrucomicrobiota bacterium]
MKNHRIPVLVKTALSATLLLASSALAHATVLVNENFESYTAGQKITTGGSWAAITTFTASNYVEVSTSAQSTFGTGSQGMNFYHGGTNANGLLAAYNFSETVTTGILTWSFDFRMPTAESLSNVFVRLVGGGAANTGPALVFDRSVAGNVYAWSGGGYGNGGNPVAQLTTSDWYRAVLSVDLDARKYSLSIVGGEYESLTSIFNNYNFVNNTTVSGLSRLQVATNLPSSPGGSFYMDNIVISTIPEPAAWTAIVATIMLPMAAFRRRRR